MFPLGRFDHHNATGNAYPALQPVTDGSCAWLSVLLRFPLQRCMKEQSPIGAGSLYFLLEGFKCEATRKLYMFEPVQGIGAHVSNAVV